MHYKRPVYIEITRDMLNQFGNPDYQYVTQLDISNPNILAIALQQAVKLINAADQPV